MAVPSFLERGGSADVYEYPDGRVLKAYRRRAHTNNVVLDWVDHDAITRAQFRAEARAYEGLQRHRGLEIYAPKYFGRLDPCGEPLIEDRVYVQGCGILLEKIPGKAVKFAHLDKTFEQQVSTVVERIRDSLGLDQVWDGSCFFPGTRARFTVIDFALWNAEDYEIPLFDRGRLTSDERAQLEKEHTG